MGEVQLTFLRVNTEQKIKRLFESPHGRWILVDKLLHAIVLSAPGVSH